MRRQQQQREQDQQSRAIYELCSLLLSILRPSSPPHPPQPSSHPISCHPSRRANSEVSPAAFASLLLGISLALMFCGSVTFVIGFMLMPWVLGLVMVFYFVGLVANLSVLGRSILLGTAAGPAAATARPTATKEMPGEKLIWIEERKLSALGK